MEFSSNLAPKFLPLSITSFIVLSDRHVSRIDVTPFRIRCEFVITIFTGNGGKDVIGAVNKQSPASVIVCIIQHFPSLSYAML